jgi:hypothetical protein
MLSLLRQACSMREADAVAAPNGGACGMPKQGEASDSRRTACGPCTRRSCQARAPAIEGCGCSGGAGKGVDTLPCPLISKAERPASPATRAERCSHPQVDPKFLRNQRYAKHGTEKAVREARAAKREAVAA